MKVIDNIRQTYAAVQNVGTGSEREASRILPIRDFNNWAKSALIQIALQPLRENVAVLDLACGKGGDLNKYRDSKVSYYAGVDITLESLIEAIRRYNGAVTRALQSGMTEYQADFIWADAFATDLGLYAESGLKFGIVSCQFALHYAFENRARAVQLFTNVKHFLARGGYFIATFPSKTTILNRLDEKAYQQNRKPPELRNELFSLEFVENYANLHENSFGQGYYFQLAEAVHKTVEYLIDIRDLNEILLQCGLRIKYEFPTLEELFTSSLTPKKQIAKFSMAMAKSARVLHRVKQCIDQRGDIDAEFWDNLEKEASQDEQDAKQIGQRVTEQIPKIENLQEIPQLYLDIINLYQAVVIEHADSNCEDGIVVRAVEKPEPRKLTDLVNLMGEEVNIAALADAFKDRMWEPAME